MARCSRLVIFYIQEKFFVLHASANHLHGFSSQSLNKQLVEFHAKQQIRQERWEAAVFAGYKVGEEIVDIGGIAVLRFSYRDDDFWNKYLN